MGKITSLIDMKSEKSRSLLSLTGQYLLLPMAIVFAFLSLLIFANEALGSLTGLHLVLTSPGVFLLDGNQSKGFTVKYYGFLLLVGMVCALISALFLSKTFQKSKEDVLFMISLSCLGGALGARLYYVLISLPRFLADPQSMFRLGEGGLAIHGCIIGLALTLFLYSRLKWHNFLQNLDFVVINLPLAQAIWRLGNFFNFEAYGSALSANAFLKVFIPPPLRTNATATESYFQPAFLFELIWDFALYLCLLSLAKLLPQTKLKEEGGFITCLYLWCYSIGRLLVESIRLDGLTFTRTMSIPTAVSLALLAGTSLILYKGYIVKDRRAQNETVKSV